MPENYQFGVVHGWAGTSLNRPECVVAHHSGLLFVPSWSGNGGISLIDLSGDTHHIVNNQSDFAIRPNGIALESGGSLLLAHMGDSSGGIFRLFADGALESVVTTANREPLPPCNFVVKDTVGRIWITVSTRKTPRATDYRRNADSGFIAVAEEGASNATIVADGLGYANECVIDESAGQVFVNETFGRRLSVFDIAGGSPVNLVNKRLLCRFGEGTYPDGLALDTHGHLWVTSIVSNRILRVAPDGECVPFFEDSMHSHLRWTEAAYRSNQMGREHLDTSQSVMVKNISNLAFAGPERSRLYLGNLLGDSLPYIDTDFQGIAMPHWNVDLGDFEKYVQRTQQ